MSISNKNINFFYPRGSEWGKWDLQVHTPASIVQHYGGDSKGSWEKFISDLEKLPYEFKVIGINDYLFVDGYKRVLEYKYKGRLKNIELILPVLEFRIEKFAGTDSRLKEINFHVIFSNKIKPETIEQQFINALTPKFKLSPGARGIEWSGVITKNSLHDLGKKIKSTVPKEKLNQYGSDMEEGFNNLVLDEKDILNTLKNSTYFKNSENHQPLYITAIGKTEWESLQWKNGSICTKKDIINKVDLVFISSQNIEKFYKAKEKLKEQNVNDLLLDCSDAHYYSDSLEKDRIGKCYTWIKANPTFKGLKQIIYEPEERIYIGNSPPKAKNSAKVIDKILIKNSNNWFEDKPILLNENLITIIGEKGAGKTALADFIAFTCGDFNTKEDDPGSFISKALKSTKQIEKTIKNCLITVYWQDGSLDSTTITRDFKNYKDSKKVRYLSQSFIEKKCRPEKADTLQKEIENIIFHYIPIQDKLNQTTFTDLKKLKTQDIELEKSNCKELIFDLNTEIYNLEEEINSLKNKKEEENKLLSEIKQLKKQKPKPTTKEEKNVEIKLELLNSRKNQLNDQIASYKEQLTAIDAVKTKIKYLKNYIDKYLISIKEDFDSINLSNLYKKLKFSIPADFNQKLDTKKIEIENLIKESQEGLKTNESTNKNDFRESKKIITDTLTSNYISMLPLNKIINLIDIFESKSSIEKEQRKTIKSFEDKIENNNKRIQALKKDIKNINKIKILLLPIKIDNRNKAYKNYFSLLQKEKKILEELHAPLKEASNNKYITEEKKQIEFFTRIELNVQDFYNKSDDIIDFNRTGKYYRKNTLLFKEIKTIAEKIEFTENLDIYTLIAQLYKTFEENGKGNLDISKQLLKDKKKIDFYNWIFDVSSFNVNYGIKYQGTCLELLSPGKKGIVLLLMYLALDTESSIPLIIDQPEENLDNKSVYSHLINYFKIAKKRIQIIVITHNPNLVLNTDAEQIIVANFEAVPISQNARIEYISGAIENSFISKEAKVPLEKQGIKEHGIDLLEGGGKAFIKRRDKYNLKD